MLYAERQDEDEETAALQQYVLQGVKETGAELGRGSYAVVYTVEYKGLTCAAKELHRALYRQGIGYAARRFQEECALLSQLRHPNIVQFLGIYTSQAGHALPTLVMEYLPQTLAQCLDQYGALPNEIGYSVLKDVALALNYLHQHSPPVIHRDLSSNNVLLTTGMTAKISDLGVARILDLNCSRLHTMTQTPGTQCYMPPEALVLNARYNSKVDVFSFGVLMVHLFSGQWPFPTVAVKVDPQDDSRMIGLSEAERRQEQLDIVGRDHPLMSLILDCIHNNPSCRPEAKEVLRQVSRTAARFPSSSANKVELLQQATTLRERLQQTFQAKEAALRAHAADTEQFQDALLAKETEIKGLQEHLAQSQDAQALQTLKTEACSLRGNVERLRQTLEDKDAVVGCLRADAERLQKSLIAKETELQLANSSHSTEIRFLRERLHRHSYEAETRFHWRSDQNRWEVLDAKIRTIESLKGDIRKLQKTLVEKEAEISSLLHALPQSAHVPSPFPQDANFSWKKCKDLPLGICRAQAIVIRGSVYLGGGGTNGGDDSYYNIYVYNPSKDKWSTLASAPVNSFGLGEFNGELVIVGGMKKSPYTCSTKVRSLSWFQKWTVCMPSMPVGTADPTVFSQPSCFLVIGGYNPSNTVSSFRIDAFIPHTSQWHELDLPPNYNRFYSWTPTVIQKRCFIVSWNCGIQEVCVTEEDVVSGSSSTTPKVSIQCKNVPGLASWKVCALVSHKQCLLSLGGKNATTEEPVDDICAFSPITMTWDRVGKLPQPVSCSSTALLPSGEILVMGGTNSQRKLTDQVWKCVIE